MRRAFPLLLGFLAVALGGFGASEPAGSQAPDMSQMRVCGADSFSLDGARCLRDERATGVRGGTLHCSARVQGLAGSSFKGTFSYRGRSFPGQIGTIPGDGHVYTSLSIPVGEFPGGTWRCEIRSGTSKAAATFTSTGPRGPLTSPAVCLTKNTVPTTTARACRADRSAKPLRPTSRITCSAVYSLARGKTASAELRYGGKPTGLELAYRLPLPVSVFSINISQKGSLPAGQYACVFSLEGKALVTKRFAIAPARA
jgi:hypothetical protein